MLCRLWAIIFHTPPPATQSVPWLPSLSRSLSLPSFLWGQFVYLLCCCCCCYCCGYKVVMARALFVAFCPPCRVVKCEEVRE